MGLLLCEEGIPLFRISELSSSGSAAPAMVGAAERFVGNSNVSGIFVVEGVGDIVEERGETTGTAAVLVELWNDVCTVVRYEGVGVC